MGVVTDQRGVPEDRDERREDRRAPVSRGYPWFATWTDGASRPEAAALRRLTGNPGAFGYAVAAMGFFAARFAGGRMPETTGNVSALAEAVYWPGEPEKLVDALVESGFLRRARRALVAVDWETLQRPHSTKWERDRARMRVNRAKVREMSRATIA